MYVFGSGRRGWRGLGLGFTNPAGTGGVLDVCRVVVVWVWSDMGLGPWSGGCFICVSCEAGFPV